jgi:aminopeptidase N
MMDNKFTRARGFFPGEWAAYGMGTNNFHHGGGMNLRGYAGYNLPNQMTSDLNNTVYNNFYTRSGIAGNVEVEFDRLVKWKPKKISDYIKFNTYLFVDAGYVVNHLGLYESFNGNYPNLKNKFLADAGLGVALTIKRWGNLFQAKPLTVRFDMPFWLSEKPEFDNSNFKFRWVLGVSRAF